MAAVARPGPAEKNEVECFPRSGVGRGVERGEVRWARDVRVWVCELGLWRAGGGPAASGCACVRACVSVVAGGGSRPASPQGARVPGRVRVGRGPAGVGGPLNGVVLPLRGPELGSLAGEKRSAGPRGGRRTRVGARPPRRAAGARAALPEAGAAAGSAPACSAA